MAEKTLKEIHEQMKKDLEKYKQKDRELMDFIKANPGGLWDFLLE